MKEFVSFLHTIIPVADHLLPLVTTLGIVAIVVFVKISLPYLKHIHLVSLANTIEGEINLAQHLAKKAGGRAVNVDSTYLEFIPAARELYRVHMNKKSET